MITRTIISASLLTQALGTPHWQVAEEPAPPYSADYEDSQTLQSGTGGAIPSSRPTAHSRDGWANPLPPGSYGAAGERLSLPPGFDAEHTLSFVRRNPALQKMVYYALKHPNAPIDDLMDLCDIKSIHIYGNYCGSDVASGKPVDAIDAACKRHDECLSAKGVDFDCSCDQAATRELNGFWASEGVGAEEGWEDALDGLRLLFHLTANTISCPAENDLTLLPGVQSYTSYGEPETTQDVYKEGPGGFPEGIYELNVEGIRDLNSEDVGPQASSDSVLLVVPLEDLLDSGILGETSGLPGGYPPLEHGEPEGVEIVKEHGTGEYVPYGDPAASTYTEEVEEEEEEA